jgi:hypothetical protein
MASTLLLAAGIGPGVGNPARALPQPEAERVGTTIPYSGRLTDEGGKPVADGAYDLSFTLYDTEAGGEPLWSEVQEGVSVLKGEFWISLGSFEPIPASALDSQERWLAVGVRGPGEPEFTALNPRQRLETAAPADTSVSAACPHDHVGETWQASIPWSNAALRISNTDNGPTILAWNYGNGNALRGQATGTGIGSYAESEDGAGAVGRSTNGRGVEGFSTNGPGVYANSTNGDSIRVDGAGGNGVYIGSSGDHGVHVASAGWSGVSVWSASGAGMWVHSAGLDGILVETANWDGVHVTGPVGGVYYGSGKQGDEDFAVLNTGEVRSKVGFAAPANDFAVTLSIEGDKAGYEPGDVLVVSASGSGEAQRSSTAYSPAIVGVYSAAPAFVGGRSVTGDAQAGGVPVAILGVVPCKVSAENGPIRPGDLLVTSATPGHAMRADHESALPGTILGKALESLDSGIGVIQVLVTLQ